MRLPRPAQMAARSPSTTRLRARRVSDAARQAPGPQHRVHYSLHSGQILITFGVAGRYSNRPDLVEQLPKVVTILSLEGRARERGPLAEAATSC